VCPLFSRYKEDDIYFSYYFGCYSHIATKEKNSTYFGEKQIDGANKGAK
jgi:hypothetical protein